MRLTTKGYFKFMSIAKLLNLKTIQDSRGNLTFIQNDSILNFEIKRVYYLHDIPFKSERGGHAHKNLQQLIIPLSGSFNIYLNNGFSEETFFMSDPTKGLFVNNLVWREMRNFSSGSVCLVLASELYYEEDYIRDFDEFIKYVSE